MSFYPVSSGQTANGIVLNAGDYMHVSSGGTAINTIVNSLYAGDALNAYGGATVLSTTVNGGRYYVAGEALSNESNTINTYVSHTEINSGGYVQVGRLFRGTAKDTIVNPYGSFYVDSYGTATQIKENGGCVTFGSSAHVTFVPNTFSGLVLSGFNATVHSGTTANGTAIEAAGYLYVYNGGTANDTTIRGGAYATSAALTVFSGGVANRTTVNSSGWLNLSGGTANDNIINWGANVYAGGKANNNTVNDLLRVYNGGKAYNNTVNDTLYVFEGGMADVATVNSGANLSVSSGGTATNITENGGFVSVESGTQVSFLPNTFSGLVLSYTSATVHSGTTANNTVVNSSGFLYVYSGGTANDTTVNWLLCLYGGSANNTIVHSVIRVYSGGIADNTVINYYNADGYVYTGGSTNRTTVSSGRLTVLSGGMANSTTVSSGGTMYISSGGTAANTVLDSSCNAYVYSGASADLATINFRCMLYVSSGGKATRIKENGGFAYIENGANVTYAPNVFSGLVLYQNSATVHSGTVADNTSVGYYGLFYVFNGGVVNSTVVSGGSLTLFGGGTANDSLINSGGRLYLSGGTANRTTVNYSSYLFVSSGGMANNTTANFGVYVYDGGVANGTIVNSGGSLFVSSGGMANNTTVNWGFYVYDGGVANTNLVNDTMRVYSGGTAINTTVKEGGYLFVSGGGKITGQLLFEKGAVVSMFDNSVLDFDLTRSSAGATVLANDLSSVKGTTTYTLTVSNSQANGKYRLAGGAAGFNRTVTVKDSDGTSIGALTVGQTAKIGGVDYTLNLGEDNVLSVSVESAGQAKPAKFDVDGNGVSDVMFVWTGYNYAHGYWMNGNANDWRSTYAVHPAEWENLGCYDMNGDGKADSVLVGNITLEAGKGAYIGYYLNGEDTDANWVNIDFLNNEAGVTWKNKVCNLTGNANANSIIWYAPDMYTVGAWLDGTSEWALLSGNFGGEFWQMVGCGDFDGDGKDSVLMSGGNGQMLYSVGIDGVAHSHGSLDWSNWEVRAIGDFAGDGKDDIVLFHSTLGAMALLVDGNADNYVSLGQLDPNDWFVVGAGDYNNDQKDDLLVRQKSTGMLGYYNACDTSETGWVEMGRGVDLNWTVIA